MPHTLQELSDRLEINDLLVRYSHAIDTKNFDLLDQVFTPDADLDYTAAGGPRGKFPEIKQWLIKALSPFPAYQHMVSNSMVTIDGDTGTGRTMCHNPMVYERDGKKEVFYCGLWYLDRYVRTPEGWRIRERSEEHGYDHGLPEDLRIPEL